MKLWLDGSPPTALLSKPYKNMNDVNDTSYIGIEVRGTATSWPAAHTATTHVHVGDGRGPTHKMQGYY